MDLYRGADLCFLSQTRPAYFTLLIAQYPGVAFVCSLTLAGIHCTYSRRDSQTELTWMLLVTSRSYDSYLSQLLTEPDIE